MSKSSSSSSSAAGTDKKPKTKYPKIFQCTGFGDCRMTFTRSEHLARHIRKHTGERPFRCHCNRYFSRLDNLRQHIQTVHANEHHILHATPPSPLPHSNKVPTNIVRHSLSTSALASNNVSQNNLQPYGFIYPQQQPQLQLQQQQQPSIIIEQQQQQPLPPPNLTYSPPQPRLRTHRPNPISLENRAMSPSSNRPSPASPFGNYHCLPPLSPNNQLYSSPSLDAIHSIKSSSSTVSTPLSTNSWLSSVLCDDVPSTSTTSSSDERTKSWGPSTPWSSTLPTLVGISENQDVEMTENLPLPSVSHMLQDNPIESAPNSHRSHKSTSSIGSNGSANAFVLPRPSSDFYSTQSSVPGPHNMPPVLSEQRPLHSLSRSGRRSLLSKPLPPLPMDEAPQQQAPPSQKQQQPQQQQKQQRPDGMDVLLQAAGV
jgi:hypothetical protein